MQLDEASIESRLQGWVPPVFDYRAVRRGERPLNVSLTRQDEQ